VRRNFFNVAEQMVVIDPPDTCEQVRL